MDPPSPSAWGADQDQLGDRQEFNLQILDILPLLSPSFANYSLLYFDIVIVQIVKKPKLIGRKKSLVDLWKTFHFQPEDIIAMHCFCERMQM